MRKLYAILAISINLLIASQALATPTAIPNTQTTINVTPSQASLLQLAKLMDVEAEAKKGFKMGFMQSLETLAMSAKNTEKLTPQQRLEVERLVQDYGDKVVSEVYTPAFSQWMVEQNMAALAETYNQQEVDAMIDFYQTAVGHSIITKQTAFMQNVTQRMASEEMLKQANVEAIGAKYAKDFEQKLKLVLKK